MDQSQTRPLSEHFEPWLENSAQNFVYPVTPDIAGNVIRPQPALQSETKKHRLIWVAVAVALVLTVLSIAPARTVVQDLMMHGPLRIFIIEPSQATTTPTVTATLLPLEESDSGLGKPAAAQPTPSTTLLTAASNLIPLKPSAPAQWYVTQTGN